MKLVLNHLESMVWLGRAKGKRETSDHYLIEGNINRQAKKYKEAKAAYLKGQKLSPNDHRILFNLLLIDLDKKKYKDAKKKYAELKKKEPVLAEELSGVYLFKRRG